MLFVARDQEHNINRVSARSTEHARYRVHLTRRRIHTPTSKRTVRMQMRCGSKSVLRARVLCHLAGLVAGHADPSVINSQPRTPQRSATRSSRSNPFTLISIADDPKLFHTRVVSEHPNWFPSLRTPFRIVRGDRGMVSVNSSAKSIVWSLGDEGSRTRGSFADRCGSLPTKVWPGSPSVHRSYCDRLIVNLAGVDLLNLPHSRRAKALAFPPPSDDPPQSESLMGPVRPGLHLVGRFVLLCSQFIVSSPS